nr:hypothetical protein [Ancylobacter sp. FA202]
MPSSTHGDLVTVHAIATKFVLRRGNTERLGEIRKALSAAGRVIIATDCGREKPTSHQSKTPPPPC